MFPTDNEFERKLARLPLAGLPPEREAALLGALLGAGIPRIAWYRRPVPLWAAACVALLMFGVSLALESQVRRQWTPPNPSIAPAFIVHVDAPLRMASGKERIQPAKWSVMNDRTVEPEGVEQ